MSACRSSTSLVHRKALTRPDSAACMSAPRACSSQHCVLHCWGQRLVVPAEIAPDCFTYNALLEAHTAAEDLEGVARVYQAMLTRGIRPDICTFVALFQVSLPSSVHLKGLPEKTQGRG